MKTEFVKTTTVQVQIKFYVTLFSYIIILLNNITFAQNNEEFKISIYGAVKLTTTFDAKDLGGSDLFKPSSIKVPTADSENQDFFMSARQSKIGVLSTIPVAGDKVSVRIEGDFHDSATNTTNLFRIRLAYLQYSHWTLGQDWSTFFDPETNPSTIDFEGPNSSTLNRVPLIRYTTDFSESTQLNVSIENPTEQVTYSGSIEHANQRFPDVAANLKLFRGQGGHLTIAGVGTELRYTDADDNFNSETGFGGLATAKLITSGKSNLKFQIAGGKGIAHFIEGIRGLGYDAVSDTTNSELETLFVLGGFLAYQHYWSESAHSTIIIGDVRLGENDLLSTQDFKSGTYGGINFFWEPIPKISFGFEFLLGQRINQNNESGTAARIQFSGQMAFN